MLQETRKLPVLPLRGLTAFPEMLIHFDVGRLMSIKALEAAMREGQTIFLTSQRELATDAPAPSDLYKVGTICIIKQILRMPGDNIRVLVEGKVRAAAQEYSLTEDGCLYAVTETAEDEVPRISPHREQALVRAAQQRFAEYAQYASRVSDDVQAAVAAGGRPGYLADFIAQNISLSFDVKQEILEERNVVRRLTMVSRLLTDEAEILRLEDTIQERLKAQVDRNQREYYLREQIKVIQHELGEDDLINECERYRQALRGLGLADTDLERVLHEVDRLGKMSATSSEAGVIRTYLDTLLVLPWCKITSDRIDLSKAAVVLDKDHYGLEKVKERILDFLAVRLLTPDVKSQVLCLVGPPGVGKTSIAKSVAAAMNRKFARLSLGGVRDEADIRGHRKTYIGAMPGRILDGMRQAGSRNPVLLLDEIDKMSSDFRGDPAAAMLEVLDGEQNSAFRDHYVEVPFDLSGVLFITTANDLSTVPRPLLDRMEVIELTSYTEAEKLEIAKHHLLKRQLKKHGLRKTQLVLSDEILCQIIAGYTREAGVRRLEQQIAKLCRKAARTVIADKKAKLVVNEENLEKLLGVPRYKKDNVTKKDEVGIVNGLAWTSVGGEMLEVEVAAVSGTGKIEITGNLGTVMQESAKAAVTYVRSRADILGIDPMFYKNTDLHIHFPEAAIPKDGPSAGVTMATAIISALTGAPVRHDVAMTGEVTLRGRVLPIGGLKEKTMAAYRAGIKTVIVPQDNKSDLSECEKVVREHISFITASSMDQVMAEALDFSRRNPPFVIADSHEPVSTRKLENEPLTIQ